MQQLTPSIDALYVPTSTTRSTRRTPSARSGRRSACSASGTRSCRPTDGAVLATAYFAIAPALPDLGDGDLPLLVADGLGLIAIAATVWSLLPAWRAQNVLAFVLLGAAVVTGILNLARRRRAGQRARGARRVGGRLLLASALATPAVALAVPLFVAAIDIWSVASGPTSRLVDAGRDPVDVLSFDIPAWGGGSAGGLGLTDAIFLPCSPAGRGGSACAGARRSRA